MNVTTSKVVAMVIVVAEILSIGAATTASAQSATQTQRQIARQQRLILQQQRQIEQNQRRLAAQQQQLGQGGAPAAAPANLNRGIFGNIGNCPPNYTYNLFNGCLPTVVVIH